MTPLNPQRQIQRNMITQVDHLYAGQYNFINVHNVSGQWSIQYPDEYPLVGQAVVMPDQNGSGLLFHVDVHDKTTGSLIRKQQGAAVFVDAETMRIDWQGLQINGQIGQPTPIAGNTTLKATQDFFDICG